MPGVGSLVFVVGRSTRNECSADARLVRLATVASATRAEFLDWSSLGLSDSNFSGVCNLRLRNGVMAISEESCSPYCFERFDSHRSAILVRKSRWRVCIVVPAIYTAFGAPTKLERTAHATRSRC